MASSKRIYTNEGGQMFIPMNVDGGSGNASFWNTTKTLVSSALGVINFLAITALSSSNWITILISIIGLLAIDQWIIRKFIIEEKYYLRMYNKQKKFEIAEPNIFWNVNIQNKNILYFLDGKMGIVVKLERDTIVGKDEAFREKHYDAWSDFYKELNMNKLKRVQMNLMDTAGNDPRFKELDKLVTGAKFNDNLKELVEKQIGHIKLKARNTLFENDYFLIYTDNYIPHEELLQKVHLCMGKLMRGAFLNYRILDRPALNELFKSEFGIKYFNEDNAAISLYGNASKGVIAFNIKSLQINSKTYTTNTTQIQRLKELAKQLSIHKIEYGEIATESLFVDKKEPHQINTDLNIKTEEPKKNKSKDDGLDNILYGDSLTGEDIEVSIDTDSSQKDISNSITDIDDEVIDF